MIRILPLLLILAACQGKDVVLSDTLPACAFPPGSNAAAGAMLDFAADQAVDIRVTTTGCLSSSCDVDRKASCSTEVSGSEIVVTSNVSWRETSGACTDDCGTLSATCTTAPLPAGVYTIRHGDQTSMLRVGETQASPCTLAPPG